MLRGNALTGSLCLDISTVSPLHLGSGSLDIWEQDDQPQGVVVSDIVWTERQGVRTPVIPGSSIKGAVRTIAEALGGGCQVTDSPCAAGRRCVACMLFGFADKDEHFQSRLSFDDALPLDPLAAADATGIADLPHAFEPRVRKGRRIYGRPMVGVSKPVLTVVVDRGTVFKTQIAIRNVTEWELGLVLTSCGLDSTFIPQLGGGKHGGLGRVRYEVTGASVFSGYEVPSPRSLSKEEAVHLALKSMATFVSALPPGADRVLETLRHTLGGPR
jgi:CRISPR/Cas system CSM-associated protein Csm3 (group 7 of RAMP superfamily)